MSINTFISYMKYLSGIYCSVDTIYKEPTKTRLFNIYLSSEVLLTKVPFQ